MTDKESTDDNNESAEGKINAVSKLVKEIPIYQDAVQPVAKEAGTALQTVGTAVNAALIPIKGLVWGIEKIETFVQTKVSEKLKSIPPENIQTPDPAVAGPALESLRYAGHKESLSEMYANLLASSMDAKTAENAHPGFVEIIRNMSSDEAKIMTYLISADVYPVIDIEKTLKNGGGTIKTHELISGIGHDAECEHRKLTSSYLVNLERLGLIEIPRTGHMTQEEGYDRIINDPPIKKIMEQLNSSDKHTGNIVKHYIRLTPLGRLFGAACIVSKT